MTQLTHYRYIDALRGFAFLGVLTVHSCVQAKLPAKLNNIALAGEYGVQLFFMLSAMTLMRSVSLRTREEHFPIRNFFIRRFFRITPLFWTGILIYGLLDGCRPRQDAPNGLGVWHFVSTFLYLQGWGITTINSVVPGGWSVAAEMTFYLCLPFLASRILSVWQSFYAFLYSLIASIALGFALEPLIEYIVPQNEFGLVRWFLYRWFPSQLPYFLLGFLVYYCLLNKNLMEVLTKPERPTMLLFSAICGMIVFSSALMDDRLISHDVLRIFFGITFAVIIIALAARPLRLFVNPLTCGLGVISFSCYITQFAVFRIVAHFINLKQFGFLSPHLASVFYYLVTWLSGLSLTVAASLLTYNLIEKPGMKLGTWIIRISEAQYAKKMAICA